MADDVIFFIAMLMASVLLDATVKPHVPGFRFATLRDGRALALHMLAMTASFGLFLAGSGNAPVAALLAFAALGLVTVASNAKCAMLGEPLVFSDLALIAAVVRHPRFYFTALSQRQRWLGAIAAVLALLALVALFTPAAFPHLIGLALLTGASGGVWLLLQSRWLATMAQAPALEDDLVRYGLVATLVLYWQRWRATSNPPPCPPLAAPRASDDPPQLIVIVQCESFADPVALTGDPTRALPGLDRARAVAWQYGELEVSGFGAYTMRTEYGVLFGRGDEALGFRRYDPFLTAYGETSYALSNRLKQADYHCSFVHPHDLRFYGRNRLMPEIGFDRLFGADDFAPVPEGGGRYVDDRTLGTSLCAMIDKIAKNSFFYVVTMENHGPWDKDRGDNNHDSVAATGLDEYLRHLHSSDAMLSALGEHLAAAGQPALLVFFGDHRPSIPGVIEPSGERHTPYVMLRFNGAGKPVAGAGRVDLSPAELHHAVIRCLRPEAWPSRVA